MDTGRRTFALVLIAMGIALLLAQEAGVGGEAIVLAIGLAFLAGWLGARAYGLLIAGAILTGLGAGIVLNEQTGNGGLVVLGLGLGFLAIWVLSPARALPGGWWPLIPGGILTAVGALTSAEAWDSVGRWWPALLIVLGLYLLVRRRAESRGLAEMRRDAPPPGGGAGGANEEG